ncbi:hypothetical protein C2845_PM14G20130 [Panicum miliaceum]|uniref:Uncharacterized protein n=1 Tax=Panicum miliaceum TaxID=4540 RepID=A0A3L6PLV7_PANMI|nr:hypothetical protein C2845_PM14G20130 [Panicum miliaceum]
MCLDLQQVSMHMKTPAESSDTADGFKANISTGNEGLYKSEFRSKMMEGVGVLLPVACRILAAQQRPPPRLLPAAIIDLEEEDTAGSKKITNAAWTPQHMAPGRWREQSLLFCY